MRKSKRVEEDYYVLDQKVIGQSEREQGPIYFYEQIRWYPHESLKLKRYSESDTNGTKLTDVKEEYDTMYNKYRVEIERNNRLRDERLEKESEIITTYVQKDKQYEKEIYLMELNRAKKNVEDAQTKMADVKYELDSANRKLQTAQQRITGVCLPYVKKITENLKSLGLIKQMGLGLIETYLDPNQSKKRDFLACDYLKDVLIKNGTYILQTLQTYEQNETIQETLRDIQSFCEIFRVSVTMLVVNPSQTTSSFNTRADMSTLLCQMKELNKIV